ncbi:hypothetical protein ABPG74_000611 [Tetrahymena malaccensis]
MWTQNLIFRKDELIYETFKRIDKGFAFTEPTQFAISQFDLQSQQLLDGYIQSITIPTVFTKLVKPSLITIPQFVLYDLYTND